MKLQRRQMKLLIAHFFYYWPALVTVSSYCQEISRDDFF